MKLTVKQLKKIIKEVFDEAQYRFDNVVEFINEEIYEAYDLGKNKVIVSNLDCETDKELDKVVNYFVEEGYKVDIISYENTKLRISWTEFPGRFVYL